MEKDYVEFWQGRVKSWNRNIVLTVLTGIVMAIVTAMTSGGRYGVLIAVVWIWPLWSAIDGRKFAKMCLTDAIESSKKA